MPVGALLDVNVLLRRGDLVLVGKRANTPFMEGHYSLFGGAVEPGESIVEAALRETEEETGLKIAAADLRLVHVIQKISINHRVSFIFETELAPAQEPRNMEPQKCSDMVWAPIADMPAPLVPYIAFALRRISEGIMFSMVSEVD